MNILGLNWLPKLGGIFAIFGAALQVVPDNAPGAGYVKPWAGFVSAVGAGLIGFTARQTNVSTTDIRLAQAAKTGNTPTTK